MVGDETEGVGVYQLNGTRIDFLITVVLYLRS